MSAYIETLNLIDRAIAAEASDESVWADYALGASRLFDLLCDVEENFFAKAGTEPAVKTLYGNGIDIIRLPPFVAGSITQISIDGTNLVSGEYRVAGNIGAQFLYDYRNSKSMFETDNVIAVTARWGFAEVPTEVKVVVTELANTLWRFRDPMFAKFSDIEAQKEVSPTTAALIKKFRDRFHQTI